MAKSLCIPGSTQSVGHEEASEAVEINVVAEEVDGEGEVEGEEDRVSNTVCHHPLSKTARARLLCNRFKSPSLDHPESHVKGSTPFVYLLLFDYLLVASKRKSVLLEIISCCGD